MTNLIVTTIIIAAAAGATGMLLALLIYLRFCRRRKGLYDYTYCEGSAELTYAISSINDMGGRLISVAQVDGLCTIFFWRPADG